ncbi:hypothetical protein TrispH2_012128, partial [Trichoplax sp. H2]
MNHSCSYCNAQMWISEKVGGTIDRPRFSDFVPDRPRFSICCLSSKISIPEIPDPPAVSRNLLRNNNRIARYFRSKIRKFNSGLCMATIKATDASITGGVSNYRIHGAVYRMIGPARNADGEQSSCIQTYFYDVDEQIRRRVNRYDSSSDERAIESEIVGSLTVMLENASNTYLLSYLTLQELMDAGEIPEDIHIGINADRRPPTEHARRFSLPTSTEIAVLLPTESYASHDERTFVCSFRAQQDSRINLQFLKDTHRSYDPLCYPVLFPFGTDGFHLGISQQSTNRTVTAKEFYSYRMMK